MRTGVDFPVGGDTVRIDDPLKDFCEFIGPVERRRRLFGLNTVEYRRKSTLAGFLSNSKYNSRSTARQQIFHLLISYESEIYSKVESVATLCSTAIRSADGRDAMTNYELFELNT